jgi:putative DNA primase/helicase
VGRVTPEAALELAYDWVSCGVPAFPIAISWDDGKHATNKRPLCEHGHCNAEATRGTLLQLFQDAYRLRPGEELGVGLWPGPANRIVLDVDDKHGLRGSDELDALEAEHGRLPDHPIVLTPSGGCHRWFAKPPGVHVGSADLAPGINVRADEGWVVAPGVVTTSGSWEVEEVTLAPAPLWPEWLAAKLTGVRNGQPNGRWRKLDRDTLDPRDRAALKALEALGGHEPYVGGDGSVLITRPGKSAGTSASIGFLGPGIVKVFTDGWPGLKKDAVYAADELVALAAGGRDNGEERSSTWQAGPAGLVARQLSTVEPEELYPVWGGRLFLRKLTAIGGPPGVGKSYLTLALARAVSKGAWVPGELTAFPLGDVLIASYEDGGADTLRPRLGALGADLARIHVIEGIRERANGGIRPFGPADVGWFARHLVTLATPRLLIIDPVSAWVGAGVDEYRSNEVRGALEGLRRIAETYGLAVILVMHLRKQAADTALNRFNGSGAYGQLVRSALVCGRDPDDEKRCAVAHVKYNLTAQLPTLGYRIDADGFHWLGEVDDLDGERLAGHDPNDEGSARAEAVEFLRAMLADGPRLAKEVQEEARSVGISEKTLRRAKKLRGVISSNDGFLGGWQWSLPSEPEEGQGGQHAHTQKDGRLGGQWPPSGDSESQPPPRGTAGTTTEGNGNPGPDVVYSPPARPCEVCRRPCVVTTNGQRVHPPCARTSAGEAA